MQKVILTKGLPASGKSTWSKKYVENHPTFKRVNKDDLRAMMDKSWSKKNEQFVLEVRDNIIIRALTEGYSVIVDDTNLHPKHEQHIEALAGLYDAGFEVRWFKTSMEQCIERDKQRPTFVGEKVIRSMWNQNEKLLLENGVQKYGLTDEVVKYVPPKGKPKAVIFDIDGTIAHHTKRSPYDWHRVGEDSVDVAVSNALRNYHDSGYYKIIILSGRDGVCRPETERWLKSYSIPYDYLYMREEGNQEKDSVVKRRIYDEHIKNNFDVDAIFDDRQQVVDMWRSLGLKCFQVQQGYF